MTRLRTWPRRRPSLTTMASSPTGPLNADEKTRIDTVRIATDNDLDAFVRQLLRLFENPKTRADLRNGRLSFRLAGSPASSQTTSRRIDSGAVTERHIVDIAESGGSAWCSGAKRYSPRWRGRRPER